MKAENAPILINEEIKTIKEITTQEDGLIRFTDIETTKKSLFELIEKHQAFTITDEDVTNPEIRKEKLSQAKEFRAEVRQPRFDLQNMLKHNKKVLNNTKKDMESDVSELINILAPLEEKIDSGVKKMEERIKWERDEKKRKEEEERNRINDLILKWSNKFPTLYDNCLSIRNPEQFTSALDELKSEIEKGVYGEQMFKAEEIFYRYNDKVKGLNEKIQKAKDQDEKEKKEKEEREKATKDRWDNYALLLDVIDNLDGDSEPFQTDSAEPYWIPDEKFQLVRNEIERLKNPVKDEPVQDEPDTAMKPSDSFEEEQGAISFDEPTSLSDIVESSEAIGNAFKDAAPTADQVSETHQTVSDELLRNENETNRLSEFKQKIKDMRSPAEIEVLSKGDVVPMETLKLENMQFEFQQDPSGKVFLIFSGNLLP